MHHTRQFGLIFQRISFVAFCTWSAWSMLQAEENSGTIPDTVVKAFRDLDKDRNESLSADEYVAGRQPAKSLRRDFQLFDFNSDGKMTIEEFLPIAHGVEFPLRGPIPDPMQTLVDQALATVDKNFKNWHERPDEEIETPLFVQMIATRPEGREGEITARDVDENGNGRVSRAEARRFFEIQLGIRRHDGERLRTPSGVINRYFTYVMLDVNNNDRLERSEYLGHVNRADKEAAEFQTADRDGDGELSFVEWKSLDWTFEDPVSVFRQMDTNFDALLDADELATNSPESKQRLVTTLIRAFDVNNDQMLSLGEFRISPHTNPILPWVRELRDVDQDQNLSVEEFTFEEPFFPLLRLEYFRRFDRNRDRLLDPTEFEYRVDSPAFMYSISEDGTDLKKIDLGPSKYFRLGASSVSPDGKWLAFDAMPRYRATHAERKIFVLELAGGEAQELCVGMMPSWSPDSQKVVCSAIAPQAGPWIIKIHEFGSTYLGNGWGAEWSPDGKKIYFYAGRTMQLYNFETKQIETLLDANEHDHKLFYWSAAWSPDSQRICVKAENDDGGFDIAIVDLAAQGKNKIRSRFRTKKMSGDFAWHPSGRRVAFVQYDIEHGRNRIYEFDPDTNDQPKIMKGTFPSSAGGMSWPQDGKRMYFCAFEQ